MAIRWMTPVLFAAAAAVLLAAATVAVADGTGTGLQWRNCGDGAVQCASLAVPVDHDDPDGEHIGLAVARLPALDPAARQGTIIFHGGGPAPSLPNLLDPGRRGRLTELTRWFDVVTFDSRGYGQSNPICDPELSAQFPILDSPAAYTRQQDQVTAFGESCRQDHPTLAEHASAQDTAHDIDAIRAALDEEQILFYGNSYGTVFGQEYATLYGHRLRRLYLDSVADHTASYLENGRRFASDREAALNSFAEQCAADAGCPLHGTDPLAVWDEVIAAAEERPLPADDGRVVTALEIRLMSGSFAAPGFGNVAAAALTQARGGDGSALAAMLDGPVQTGDVGQLTECADFPVRPDNYQELREAAEQARKATPRIGWLTPVAGSYKCAGWPLPTTNDPAPLAAPHAPPALVVNATQGGITHLTGAQHVADQIEGSVVLAGTGFGHALYQYSPDNRCIRDAVHRYLLEGTLPVAGAECPL